MMRAGFVVSQSCRWGKKIDVLGLTNGRKSPRVHVAALRRDHASGTRYAVGANSAVPRACPTGHDPNLCCVHHRADQRELSAGVVAVRFPFEWVPGGWMLEFRRKFKTLLIRRWCLS